MNGPFSHYNVRALFTPSRLTAIEGPEDLKLDAEGKMTAKSTGDCADLNGSNVINKNIDINKESNLFNS